MTTWNPKANEIFLTALEIESHDDLLAYIDQACANEPGLRADVNGLLAAADNANSFLNAPLAVVAANRDATELYHQSNESPGDNIGPYKLLEQIGQGGFGTVYMADQTAPVKRRVALKVLKPGMDTKEVIARFEAERQALAMMDHPNIARVLDGGQTPEGRPYFVMELVRGVAITEYCDEARLSNEERLRLFIDVCRAVQHAHLKGIIHRDLKPSNVMVTSHDDKAVPKVIDFGIAKALSQPLTDRTLFTGYQQLLGTPMYMSPEQAQMSGIDIDTRSDVYSLGVLLYELLTGTTPFTKESLSKVGFDELRRIIREQEPPRPSTRLTTLDAKARSTIADRRRLDQRQISNVLRGELDWIVMKALEKDRTRRYESASALAADIERYLQDQPIDARPPSVRYRLGKFAHRNRGRLLAGSLVIVAVLAGLLIAVDAKLDRDRAYRRIDLAVQSSISAARAAITGGDLAVARERVAEAHGRLVHAGIEMAMLTSTVEQLGEEIEQRHAEQQRFQQFEQVARDAMDTMSYGAEGGGADQPALEALSSYGILDDDTWPDRLQKSYLNALQQATVRQTAYETLLSLADYGVRWEGFRTSETAHKSLDYLELAAAFHEPTRAFYWVRSECFKFLDNEAEAQKDLERFQGTKATSAFDYFLPGHTAGWRGDLDEAIRSYQAALRIQPDHFNSLFFLAMRLSKVGRNGEAAQLYRACLVLRPDHVPTLRNRADLLRANEELDEALELTSKVIELIGAKGSANQVAVRGGIYVGRGQYKEALIDLDTALEHITREDFSDKDLAKFVHSNRAELFQRMGQVNKALEASNAAIALAPEQIDLLAQRARILVSMNEYVQALADVDNVLRIAASSKNVPVVSVVYAHFTRARVFFDTERYGEALTELEQALGLAPNYRMELIREIQIGRAETLLKLNRIDEGISDSIESSRRCPRSRQVRGPWPSTT